MNHMIDDNRFALIEKYKQKLIEGTNISDRPEEMAVIDNILFRLWQMGWLDKLEEETKWIPVTEVTPTEDDDYWVTFDAETGRFVDWASWYQGRWVTWIEGSPAPLSNVIAWCKPIEPYKGVTE